MDKHFLITIKDIPEPYWPGDIPADAEVVVKVIVTPTDGFGHTIFSREPETRTVFAKLQSHLTEMI